MPPEQTENDSELEDKTEMRETKAGTGESMCQVGGGEGSRTF